MVLSCWMWLLTHPSYQEARLVQKVLTGSCLALKKPTPERGEGVGRFSVKVALA
jgi:hypothetical protein